MTPTSVHALLSAALALLLASAHGQRLKDRIYRDLDIGGYCFRRTNGTHQVGCQSPMGGNVGVVQLIRGSEDVRKVVKTGSHAPYIAVFTPETFTAETLIKMRESGRISGAVLAHKKGDVSGLPEGYSDDAKCPNQASSLYAASEEGVCDAERSPWNPFGSGLLKEDFPFPIFYTKDEATIDFLVDDCFGEHNEAEDAAWPLCAVELQAHMYAAVDSETCIRRSETITSLLPTRYCDRMGDYNTFYFMEERNASSTFDDDSDAADSVVLVSAQIDAITMFDKTEYGADMPVTPLVTLLETARLLAKNPPTFDGQVKNILFAFFFGEAFDYSGSSRFTYDMKEGLFPSKPDNESFSEGEQPLLKVEHLHSMIEIGQMFNAKSGGRLFAHTDTQFDDRDGLVRRLTRFSQQNDVPMRTANSRGLPPSSAQSLLKARRDLPAIFVSDFDSEYSNSFYHSVFDDASGNLGYNYTDGEGQEVVQHIARSAVTLAEYLYETASDRNARLPSFEADKDGINEMLKCYLESAKCDLFTAVSDAPPPSSLDYVYPQYVGVEWKKQYHGIFTRRLLALLTAKEVPEIETKDECVTPEKQNVFEYIFLKGLDPPVDEWDHPDVPCNETSECGRCYKTLSFRRSSLSPAFVIEDYDFTSPEYGAWAESVWKVVNARIFLKGNPVLDGVAFAFGLSVFLLSLGVVFVASAGAKDMFQPEQSIVGGSAAAAPVAGGSNATMITTNTTDSQPRPAAL